MQAISSILRVVWACMKKDIKSALSERLFTSVSVFIPLNMLLLLSLMVISGGQAPTAVVMQDSGPLAQQLYTAMSHAHSFVLQKASEAEAHALIEEGRIVAVVTIPADFDQRLHRNQKVEVDVQINNLNTDFTNDIRRAVPLSITNFYAKAFPHLVTITPHEVDSYGQDTDYIPYLMVSVLVMGLMIGGLVQAGTAAAVEWERETAKELLLAPASRPAMLLGKMLGAFVVSLASAVLMLVVLTIVVGIWPVHWGEVMGFTLLVLAIFIAWGTLLGTVLKQRMPVATLAMGATIPLFFLSGPFGPISFFAPIEQVTARLFPVYYAIVVLQHAFHNFTLNTSGMGINVLILVGYALAGLILATIVLRQRTMAH
jgi:ABC-2 type transport system permease protein